MISMTLDGFANEWCANLWNTEASRRKKYEFKFGHTEFKGT